MIPGYEFFALLGREAGNHLWQSTAFAAAAGLLALALRANHARARYWLWLAASLKFLIPFNLLTDVGSRLGAWLVPAAPSPRLSVVIEQIALSFTPIQQVLPAGPTAPARAAGLSLPALLAVVWCCGFAAVLFHWWRGWRRAAAAVRASAPLREGRELDAWGRLLRGAPFMPPSIALVSSRATLEPGIFGIFRPVLCLPESISSCLSDAELDAILAHELCHARRHDNLAGMIHMAVEAIFWFHPLVWWLGARLVEERERACDEEVVQLGSEPQVYAESILKVCELCLASRLACVAGITGADLKKRMASIMANRFTGKLNLRKKLLLATAAAMAVAGPIAIGVTNGQRIQEQSPPTFEVASVRPSGPVRPDSYVPERHVTGGPGTSNPEQITYSRFPLMWLIHEAHNVAFDQIVGPGWLTNEPYTIVAKVPPGASKVQAALMLQNLLAERFGLAFHREKKEFPVYALSIAKTGPKLKEAADSNGKTLRPGDARPIADRDGFPQFPAGVRGVAGHVSNGINHMTFRGSSIADLVRWLGNDFGSKVGSSLWTPGRIVDNTGLTGSYDFTIECACFMGIGSALSAPDLFAERGASGASLVSALEKQLGLKIEKSKAMLDVLIIDHVEKTPTEN